MMGRGVTVSELYTRAAWPEKALASSSSLVEILRRKSTDCFSCRLPVCGDTWATPNGTVRPWVGSLTSWRALADQVLSSRRYSNRSNSRLILVRLMADLTCSHSARPARSAVALPSQRTMSCSQAMFQQFLSERRCFFPVLRKDFFMQILQKWAAEVCAA